jgi:hypothetical protein
MAPFSATSSPSPYSAATISSMSSPGPWTLPLSKRPSKISTWTVTLPIRRSASAARPRIKGFTATSATSSRMPTLTSLSRSRPHRDRPRRGGPALAGPHGHGGVWGELFLVVFPATPGDPDPLTKPGASDTVIKH